ncbi:MAG: hypothetical protein WAQ77_10435 [Candidatus Acidiferrum sp.]
MLELAIAFMIPPLNPDFTKIPLRQAMCITGWSCGVLESRLQIAFQSMRRSRFLALINPTQWSLLFTFFDNFAYSFRADLAMRGSAISVLMRACVAFLVSFLAFFRGMRS